MSLTPAIEIRGLTKRYGRITAVNNLSFEVPPGEIFGFLGLNGAGKTTTIRILLDLLRPSKGRASVFGHDCQTDGIQARSSIGYLPGELGIYSDLTGREVLDFLAGLGPQSVNTQVRGELQERLELSGSQLHQKLREYSTGMKRKLGLIQAFQSDPMLVILDEPTEGLDPLMQESFYELVRSARRRGRTVFMSSHVLPEVERVCDRFALIRDGELVLLSTIEETRNLAARRVRVFFSEDVRIMELPQGHKILESTAREWNLVVDGPLGRLVKILAALPVLDMQVEQPRLEDVVMKYYRADT